MDLSMILDDVQKTADAISSVLGVEVTIVNSKLERIAGTGHYSSCISQKSSQHSAFAKVIESGKEFFIENPRVSYICINCEKKHECKETSGICCPIFFREEIIGVIGLISFNEKQKEMLIKNKYKLLNFIRKMADLLVSKLMLYNKNREKIYSFPAFEVLSNKINSSIIFTDKYGTIKSINNEAKKLFKITDLYNGKNIKKLIPSIDIDNIIKNATCFTKKNFTYKKEKYTLENFYSVDLVENYKDLSIEGIVFSFDVQTNMKNIDETYSNTNIEINFDDIIGNSLVINTVKEKAKKAALGNSIVLITGDSGTGKELFARSIHSSSNRRNGPFIAINCAAIPDTLLESELFGYEDGAFTGAKKGGKPGKFDLANNGTIFLDEIGDMKIHLQAKLLRVIQDGVIDRIGSNASIKVNARIIAATHRELHRKVEEGEFREDLFYRLSVIPIRIPPLREREGDVMIIAKNFLKKFNNIFNKNITGFDLEVEKIFNNYTWPGNIRELENAIEYSVNMASVGKITTKDLHVRFNTNHNKDHLINKESLYKINNLKDIEIKEIKKALLFYGRNKKGVIASAEALGISKATLYRRIKEYDIY